MSALRSSADVAPRASADDALRSTARLARASAWVALVSALVACRGGETVTVQITDGVIVPPHASPEAWIPRLEALGVERLLVPWTDPSNDVAAIRDAVRGTSIELVVGLGAARTADDEWNGPTIAAASTAAAIERALIAGDVLAGVHLDHAAPGLPDANLAAYLDATVAAIRAATDAPISFALQARRISVAQLQDGGFPAPPAGTPVSALDSELAAIEWANAWASVLAGRVDRVLVHGEDAAWDDVPRVSEDLARLVRALDGRAEVWASVDALAAVAPEGAAIQRVRPARPRSDVEAEVRVMRTHARTVFVTGAASFEPARFLAPDQATRAAPIDVADPNVQGRAEDVLARLSRCCLRDGQVVPVYDHRFERDHGDNVWQEDACWLTGLYTSALSFRAAVLGTPEARDQARAAWRALHQLASTTPLRGEVVRTYARTLYGTQTRLEPGADTKKRWHRAPDRELYWVGDISVDQLSGWFQGVAVYHDLVATPEERATIASDVTAVLDMFLANDLHAIEHDGGRTTFGDLRAQPVLALAFFQIGAHVATDPARRAAYRAEYERLLDEEGAHFAIGNVLATYHAVGRYGSDHFYSSGFYPLLMYETEPARRAELALAFHVFHVLERPFGNAYADVVTAVFRPDADAARRASHALTAYRPALTANAAWLASFDAYHEGPFVPVEARPAAELDFDYVPPGAARLRGGLEHRFPGVGFLVSYWMARYHGLLVPVDPPRRNGS
ncbi:hypothetical protein L6R52_08055 [Myxococcota bacterium]|nr:hypothetical protein [Myxococcota bacterium]